MGLYREYQDTAPIENEKSSEAEYAELEKRVNSTVEKNILIFTLSPSSKNRVCHCIVYPPVTPITSARLTGADPIINVGLVPEYETPVTFPDVYGVDETIDPSAVVAFTVKVYIPAESLVPLLSVPSQERVWSPAASAPVVNVSTVFPFESAIVTVAELAAESRLNNMDAFVVPSNEMELPLALIVAPINPAADMDAELFWAASKFVKLVLTLYDCSTCVMLDI